MTRECHVRFCERLGVRLPKPTRLMNSCLDFMLSAKEAGHDSYVLTANLRGLAVENR